MEPAETPLPDTPPITTSTRNAVLPEFVERILQVAIVLLLPVFLILGSVRLVMSERFLRLEYKRPGFPEDPYGFSTQDRLEYGPYGVRYLLNDKDIAYLSNLQINGRPAFNPDELRHMQDVKAVTRMALRILMLAGALLAGSLILLARERPAHARLRQSLRYGGLLTLGIFLVAGVIVVVAWGFFFDTFHQIFFDEGTWQFSRSDTLIRLYPEQFWFDATVTIAGLTLAGALICIGLPWYWERRTRALID